jgi:DNA-binding CsgD family transcriptional regulator
LRYARTAAAELDHGLRHGTDRCAPGARWTRLTSREVEILRLLADGGISQKDLARSLGVSRNTVRSHVKSIYMKLGIHSRYEAIQTGRELGLIPHYETLPTPERQPVQRLMLVSGSSRRER